MYKIIKSSVACKYNHSKDNIKSLVKECCDSEARSTRLTCFGLPDNSDSIADLALLKSFANKLHLNPNSVIYCSRLDKSTANGTRLLKIQFSSRSAAVKFLTSAKSAITSDSQYSKVWFRKDLSMSEQVDDSNLCKELFKKRRFSPCIEFIIYRGQVINKLHKPCLQYA